jgi:hypothetical protein
MLNETDAKPAVAAYPPPLIPSDVDPLDFRFMPLDVVQPGTAAGERREREKRTQNGRLMNNDSENGEGHADGNRA